MPEKYQFHNPDGVYFVTPTVVHWIDVFTRKEYCYIITDALNYCIDNKGLRVHGWCIMTSHLHFLISSENGTLLSDIIRDFKQFTSKKIVQEVQTMIDESRREWLLKAFTRSGEKLRRVDTF